MLFYADENFPVDVVIELRDSGHDVLTALEDGRANRAIEDEDVLRRATELRRAVLTINRQDFKRLHQVRPAHAGIVICTADLDFAGQARRIDEACRQAGDVSNKLIRVYRPA